MFVLIQGLLIGVVFAIMRGFLSLGREDSNTSEKSTSRSCDHTKRRPTTLGDDDGKVEWLGGMFRSDDWDDWC